MNAPARVTKPARYLRPPMPFNLQPYAEGEFDRMHGPGAMMVSASNVFALFNAKPERLGKLSYAAHLTGQDPQPNISDDPLIRVGHALEPLAAELLSEKLEAEVVKHDAYSRHDYLDMFATPDGVVVLDGVPHIVELKVVTPKVWWGDWVSEDRDLISPPRHIQLQHQAQFACTGATAGIIGVLSLDFCTIEWFPTKPHQAAIDRIELAVDSFMATLKRGELPDPDDTEVDFEAFRHLMWQSDPEKTVRIKGDEAIRRAGQFLQAKDDEAAATKTIQAQKRFFMGLMKDAQVATLEDGTEVEWKTNKKGKGQERPARVFKIKEAKEQIDG